MPRTTVPITDLTFNGGFQEVAGTAIDNTDGNAIEVAGDTRGLVIKFLSSFAGVRTVTIPAATDAHALRGPIGDLTFDFDNTEIEYVTLESSRFCQAVSEVAAAANVRQIFIDVAGDQTGFIWAYRLPDGA